jgi:hypothetical protein
MNNNKKCLSLCELEKLSNREIKDLKINRIVSTSNFDREMFWEEDFMVKIPSIVMKEVCKVVMDKLNTSESPLYFKAAYESYELYQWEP